jgi:hypothetical protein
MFQLLADESGWRRIRRRAKEWGLGLGVHLTAMLTLAGQRWLFAILTAVATADQPPLPPARETFTILAPPPGKTMRSTALSFSGSLRESTPPGASVRIEDGTDIAFDADDSRQLLPVLKAFDGLIVFVPLLDRLHPQAAFRPDGSSAPLPGTLDHWVRIRLANPSWWPEVEALCSAANSDGSMEAVAVLPPVYRAKLGAAVQSRMAELRSAGRIVGVSLRLEAGHPAGVVVQSVRLAGQAG